MNKDKQPDLFGEAPQAIKPLSPVGRRLVKSSVAIVEEAPTEIVFQHAVLCQTGLPYRNPGDDVRAWQRSQGRTALSVEAGTAFDEENDEWVPMGLPYGPKPRVILAHLNTEAILNSSPNIEVEDSLTAFVKRLKLDTKGRNMRLIKDQLGRLSTSHVRLAHSVDGRSRQVNAQVVSGFDLWFPKDQRQRVLWPSEIRLSLDYFESLSKHAVPLDERAVASLSHSAMALDVYAWLAYRLHLVPWGNGQFITWKALKDQFGWHYGRMDNFKSAFRKTLHDVVSQYNGANFDLDNKGITLRNSPPPIKGRLGVVRKRDILSQP